jgi:hypothetical protein
MGSATGSQRDLTFAATERGSRRRESALKGFRNGLRNRQSARTDVRGYGAG